MADKRRKWLRFAVLVLALVVGFGFWALAPVLGKLDYSRLLSRAGWQHPTRVVESLELTPGTKVADIGAGDGYFTFRLADAVGPAGKVYAVDVTESIVDKLKSEVQARGYENIEVVLGELDDPLLPDGEIDVAFFSNVYHHIDERIRYFDRLRSDLKPGGRVAIVEVSDTPVRFLAPPGHWTPVDRLDQEMAMAHYRKDKSFDFLPIQNFQIYAVAEEP